MRVCKAQISAAEGGSSFVLGTLLLCGADVNARTRSDGSTGLMLAAEKGHESVVRQLLEAGASLNLKDQMGRTALARAVRKRNEAMVKVLLEAGADPDVKDIEGNAALIIATDNGDVGIAKALLAAKADANTRGAGGRTALIKAAKRGDAAMVGALLEAGADTQARGDNAANGRGVRFKSPRSALLEAAMRGDKPMVEALQKAGAHIRDDYSAAALLEVVAADREDLVELLLSLGADPNGKDEYGHTTLIVALRHNYTGIVEHLLAARANPNMPSTLGLTPLILAVDMNNVVAVEHLLAAGAAVGEMGYNKDYESEVLEMRSSLTFSSSNQNSGQPSLFATQDAQQQPFQTSATVSCNKTTALHEAARLGRTDVARVLAEKADLSMQNMSGRTAAQEAEFHGYKELADILKGMEAAKKAAPAPAGQQ